MTYPTMNNVCPASRMTSGSASSASCQIFKVIIAMPKNSDRQIPPISLISPIYTV